MRSMRGIVSALILLVAIAIAFWQRDAAREAQSSTPAATERSTREADRTPRSDDGAASHPWDRSAGFRSDALLVEHYRKHGREFGAISQDEYLRGAQELRDRPAGGDVLEGTRADGVITRYDRSTGAFLAFNRDGSIRTFFRPNQGETYFRRQLTRRAR